MENIIFLVRYLIKDNSSDTSDIFTYENSAIFTLTEINIIEVSAVYKNDVILSEDDWSYNSTTKKVTISASLTSKDTIQIDYSYYPNYSDTEIKAYIHSSLVYLSNYNYENFEVESGDNIYPEPTKEEEKLIALITSIIIDPNNQTIRLPDLTITPQSNLSLEDKIAKAISSFKKNTTGLFELL